MHVTTKNHKTPKRTSRRHIVIAQSRKEPKPEEDIYRGLLVHPTPNSIKHMYHLLSSQNHTAKFISSSIWPFFFGSSYYI